MSIGKTKTTFEARCDRCKDATLTVTLDEPYFDEEVTEAVESEDWRVLPGFRGVEAVHLCRDCPSCEDIGHTWEPSTDGIIRLEHTIRCALCGYAPHVPERSYLTEEEASRIVISRGPAWEATAS